MKLDPSRFLATLKRRVAALSQFQTQKVQPWSPAPVGARQTAVHLVEMLPSLPLAATGPLLFRDANETFGAWIAAINHASKEIFLEMYWMADDRTGKMFANALQSRARAGIRVVVVVDGFGSLTSGSLLRAMERDGVVVHVFHPLRPWVPSFLWKHVVRRDHRKMLVVDRAAGFVGGLNICDEANDVEQGGRGWHDFSMAIQGPQVEKLAQAFLDTVHHVRERKTVRAVWVRRQRPRQQRSIPPAEPYDAEVHIHPPRKGKQSLRRIYLDKIETASERIVLAHSYFIPDRRIRAGLRDAANRGVRVQIIVPGHSDVPWAALGSHAVYQRLMEAGAEIYEWQGEMLHAKVAVIDDWATVGSYNLDYRSFHFNRELNLATKDESFVDKLMLELEADIRQSKRVTLDEWRRRPRARKVLEWLAYRVRRWL